MNMFRALVRARQLHTKYTAIAIKDTISPTLAAEAKLSQLNNIAHTCQCSFDLLEKKFDLPEKFEKLNIDTEIYEKNTSTALASEIPSFKSHVFLISPSNSHDQWKSKIELDAATFPYNVVGPLKNSLKNCSIMVNAISFDPKITAGSNSILGYDPTKLKFLCVPEMVVVEIEKDNDLSLSNFIKYLEYNYRENDEIYNPFTRDPNTQSSVTHLPRVESVSLKQIGKVTNVDQDLLFVCAHTKRDIRCGVIAPLLIKEVNNWNSKKKQDKQYIGGFVSHIGGHKFAGNVMVYQQDNLRVDGLWFRQVTPNLVSLLLDNLDEKKIIKELYRGHFKHMKF